MTTYATDVMGVSGRAMMRALIAGQSDSAALAELAKGRMRTKIPDLRKALTGRFREDHGFLLKRMLDHVEAQEAEIVALDERIESALAPFAAKVELLRTIPGVDRCSAQVILTTSTSITFGHFLAARWCNSGSSARGGDFHRRGHCGIIRNTDLHGDEKLRHSAGRTHYPEPRAAKPTESADCFNDRKRESTVGEFSGKVALVTGSMSGIGAAIADRLAREGATVVLNSRSTPTVPVRLPGSDTDAMHVACDVADETAVAAMVTAVEERYGGLDILINCAGVTVFVPHDDLTSIEAADWTRILGVNIVGPWNTIKAAEHLLRRSDLGVAINISSMAGIRPAGSSIPYAVSKAGLNHLTALLARALGPDIRVNAIAPGFVQTRWAKDYNKRRLEIEVLAPLHRVGQPEEVAEVCIGLIRASYVTGQVVAVDGGLSLL